MQLHITIPLVALAAFLFSAPAGAVHQRSLPRCGDATVMKKILTEKWGESAVASGLLTNGEHILVWYGNSTTGTWSVVSFSPDGIACLLGAGKNFLRFNKPKPKPKEKPA